MFSLTVVPQAPGSPPRYLPPLMTNALIFGGGGIGQAVASALVKTGARVVLVSRDEGLARRLGVEGHTADLSVEAQAWQREAFDEGAAQKPMGMGREQGRGAGHGCVRGHEVVEHHAHHVA